MKRPARRGTRRSFSLCSHFSVRQSFEHLEPRVLLCGTPTEAIAAGVPASMFMSDGHIRYSDYITLSPKLQAHLDPHLIQSQLSDAPINWDQVLGLPLHPEGPPTSSTPSTDAITDAYPDFFPSLYNGFLIDQTNQAGRTLLRFGTQVNNQGLGPCSLISGRPGVDSIPTGAPITSWVNADGSQNVLQAVYAWNDSTARFQLSFYRAGGRFTYHAGHGHFHYDGYAYYKLRQNVAGQPGPYVTRADGTGVVGEKVGFCLLDFVNGSWNTLSPPDGPGGLNTALPHYNAAGQPSNGCGLLQGVTVGHADGYSNSLDGQWIDVTGVPNGQYFVEIQLDGENAVTESNENNNTRTFAYTLNVNQTTGGISPDQFDTGTSHNDTFGTATDVGAMGTFVQPGLTIHWGEDFDYFKFTATSSGSATVQARYSNGDVNLYLYDRDQTQIGASTSPNTGSTSSPVTETITYNFVAGQTYFLMANAYNNSESNNYQIMYNLKPQISYPATDAFASEQGPNPGTFVVSRNGPVTGPITVTLGIAGTAGNNVDYVLNVTGGNLVGNQLTIGDLSSSATITVVPIQDNIPERTETVALTITSTSAYVSSGGTSTIKIYDTADAVGGDTGGPGGPGGGTGPAPGIFGTTSLLSTNDTTSGGGLIGSSAQRVDDLLALI